MSIFSFFSTKRSKQRESDAAKDVSAAPVATDAPVVPAATVAPGAPVPFKPRQVPKGGRKAAQRDRNAAQAQPVKAESAAAKPQPTPAASTAGPAVPPVGARGETDLEPSHATFQGMTFPSVEGSGNDVDRAAIRELFSDIAAGQAGPVKTFIGDLRAKNATGEWLQVCRPVMGVLLESATSLGMDDAVAPMNEFISALDLAAESMEGEDGPIDGAARDVLLETYESLAKVFPEIFALSGPVSRRDVMLLHALLKQVQGVGIVTFDALYGAGLTSVEVLSQANPVDLASVTGLSVPLCVAICAGLHEHRLDVERTAHLPAAKRYTGRLTDLLRVLAREHDAFTRVVEESGFDEVRAERKRAARRNRNLCALKIEATLVEMELVDAADELRVLSFDRRIEYLEKFLGVRVAKRAAEHR